MKRRILFAIVGVAAFAVVAFGVPLAWTIRRIEHDDTRSTLQREAARAALEVPSLVDGDTIELPAPGTSGVTLAVYGPDGNRVVGNGPDRADRATLAALQGRLAEYTDASAITVGWPLTSNEQTFGAIRAALPESQFENRVHELWLLMGVLGLLVIAATALVARRQASRLARPVGDLTDAVRQLGDGDFAIEAPASGVDELDAAGHALTATAERLRKLVAWSARSRLMFPTSCSLRSRAFGSPWRTPRPARLTRLSRSVKRSSRWTGSKRQSANC